MVMAFILEKGPAGTVGVEVNVTVAVVAGGKVAVGGAGVRVGAFVAVRSGDSARLAAPGSWVVAVTNPAGTLFRLRMNWLYTKIPLTIRQARIRTPAIPPPINTGRMPTFRRAAGIELRLAGEAGMPGGLSTAIEPGLAAIFSGEEGGGPSEAAGCSIMVASIGSGSGCSMSVASPAGITALGRVEGWGWASFRGEGIS